MPSSSSALRRVRAAVLAALALVAAPPAVADDAAPAYVLPDFVASAPPLPAGGQAEAAWRLGLGDALALAVRYNLGVVLEREALAIAERGVDVARGAFEPTVGATYRHGDVTVPPATSQEGMPGETNTIVDDAVGVSYAQRLSTGLAVDIELDSGRTRSTAGTAVAPLNIRSTLGVSVRQPLLRGFSTDLVVPRLGVLRAKLASERQRQQMAIVIARVVEETERAYWDVVQALYRHDLAVRSAGRAEEQLALTRRQIDAGVLPPSDLIGAESTLAQRELQRVQAEQQVEQAWDRLRQAINLPRDQWARPILPVEAPRFEPSELDDERALAAALTHRPEYAQLGLDIEAAVLAVRQAKNDRLPQIDLGLSGSLVGQDASYGGAFDQLTSGEARGWSVFVTMSWTPLRRASSAAVEIERARERVVRAQREQVLQGVWAEVRDAVRAQRSAGRQVMAAARFRELAERSLELEQRKFLNGTSSNFLVAQRQEEVASAQLAELDALLGHQKAAAALLHATGLLLEERQIRLDVVAGGRP
ncbi:MAG TPA: TolC family protein [Kofleriaceae bacterium]|jgi:outer membrane protein TolC|nr:TolC family protein [Kofleriaceae bacterium]